MLSRGRNVEGVRGGGRRAVKLVRMRWDEVGSEGSTCNGGTIGARRLRVREHSWPHLPGVVFR
eukprot:1176283-Prorocentrum_minimum.AAC.2